MERGACYLKVETSVFSLSSLTSEQGAGDGVELASFILFFVFVCLFFIGPNLSETQVT